MRKRIIFRADANTIIGFGHFYRLLALADILKDDFDCSFAINHPGDAARMRIAATCNLIALATTYIYTVPDLVSHRNGMPFDLDDIITKNDIVVLDGYHFLEEYQEGLHRLGCTQVCIDDLAGNYPFAKAIINHAPGLSQADYNRKARLCLGLDYALLRKPFFSPFKRKDTGNGNAYISMGGSDMYGFSVIVCKGLLLWGRFGHIHILCSDQFTKEQLDQLRLLENKHNVTLHFNLAAQEIVDVMDKCSFAFVATSTVLIEAYARGLKCFNGYSAQNQLLMYKGFTGQMLSTGIGDLRKITAESIPVMITKAEASDVKVLEAPLDSIHSYLELFKSLVYDEA